MAKRNYRIAFRVQHQNGTTTASQIFSGIKTDVAKIAGRNEGIGAGRDLRHGGETAVADQSAARIAGGQVRGNRCAERAAEEYDVLRFSTTLGNDMLPDRVRSLIKSALAGVSPAGAESRIIDDCYGRTERSKIRNGAHLVADIPNRSGKAEDNFVGIGTLHIPTLKGHPAGGSQK